jgi:glyoxylase-like metal-dependent hydrolase (beta-lactamase superfamily II)
MHPDHLGAAAWLCEQWHRPPQECRLWISATDWAVARAARLQHGGYSGDRSADFQARHGITDTAWLTELRERPNHYAQMVPALPPRYRRLMDRQGLRIGQHDWFCIAGYGHAPEHMALHCPALGLLISGDMVLPRISTNISVIDLEPEADPLTLYLQSLDVIAQRVPEANTLVLPSHGRPFTGLHARIQALHQHHADRLADMHAACTAQGPQSAAELMPVMFPRALDAQQIGFAMGETIAHANCLWLQGRLRPILGADGVQRYAALT